MAIAITSVIVTGEVPVADWQAAGLLKPAILKPIFATFEQTTIQRQLGALAETDKAALRKLIHSVLA